MVLVDGVRGRARLIGILTPSDCPCSLRPHAQLYPYHLVGYIARVMRVTPHAYYADILTACLAAEKPYHQLPNFTVSASRPMRHHDVPGSAALMWK